MEVPAETEPVGFDVEKSLRLAWMDPSELVQNPRNFRLHPESQMSALTGVIAEVGWAGACLFNERTGRLIDGHARRKVALEQGSKKVPVLVGNWTEEQEKKILATFDPISALAEVDEKNLAALLDGMEFENESVNKLLADLSATPSIDDLNIEPDEEQWPSLEETKSHQITLRYTPDDEPAIKKFVGTKDSEPLDPIHTGKKILERIKAQTAG